MNTSPTVADFAAARFAENPAGAPYVRADPGASYPWIGSVQGTICRFSDQFAADSGWRIVTPVPEVDDAMVERARESLRMDGWIVAESSKSLTRALRAALTPEPLRPEGAAELEAIIRERASSRPDGSYAELADYLAARGVRVGGGER